MNTALKISKDANNAEFEKCKIYGKVDNSGQNIKFKKTSIGFINFTQNHPMLYGVISAVSGGIILLIIEYLLFKPIFN